MSMNSRFAALAGVESDDEDSNNFIKSEKSLNEQQEINKSPQNKTNSEITGLKDNQEIDSNLNKLSKNDNISKPNKKISRNSKPINKIKRDSLTKNEDQLLDNDINNQWYYLDPTGQPLGPYSNKIMKFWFEKKLIDSSLLIKSSLKMENNYSTISQIFPDLSVAFSDLNKNLNNNINIPKQNKLENYRTEKTLNTLYSISLEEKNEDLLDIWEKIDENAFK